MSAEPTQANDAEISVLGAAMSGYNDVDTLAEIVTVADFYHPANGDVWDAILRVHRGGVKPDPITVRLALGDEWAKRHDPLALVNMTHNVPIVAQAPYYAETVARAALLRNIQTAGIKVTQMASSASADPETIGEQARAVIDDATRGRSVARARSLAEVLPEVIETAESGGAHMLSTPWDDLDRTIGGFSPGRLIVVGARPGVGKSLMGGDMALWMARRHQHAVHFASLEMPRLEVGQRLVANMAKVDLTGLQKGELSEGQWERVNAHFSELADLPIYVDDLPDQSITHVRRMARNTQRARDDLALIVVDYLQLMKPAPGVTNRVEQLGEISRGLKLLARESGACVVAMAQVNRESTKRTDGRPTLADLRESGSIEADADQVVLLHQPDENLPELECITAKNRHGPKGQCQLMVRGHHAQLVAAAWTPTGSLRRNA